MNRFALYPFLVKQWKYAVLASLVVAAVIVPSPNVKAMGIYAAPILALYGLSLELRGWCSGIPQSRSATISSTLQT